MRRSAPSTIRSSESVKSASLHLVVAAAGGGQRGLVDEVAQVGADHPGRRGGERVEVDVRRRAARRGCAPRGSAARPVWSGGFTVTRRSNRPGPQQRRVEDLGAVRRRDHDHALGAGEAVHLGQDLVQRLLALVVAAAECVRAAAGAADRVELVDEDDRRRRRLGLGEQVAHAARADADDRLDELRRRDREERHRRLAGDRPREQRLAGARQARTAARPSARSRRGAVYRSGLRRKSTTSASSSSASSMPATSSNVTRLAVASGS